jgi:hypothetical protein
LLGALVAVPSRAEIDRADVIRLSASVLKIEVLRTQGGYALGSGVVVAPDMIVTNCHVTRDGREVYVLRGGARWRVESQASDPEHDLCALRVPGMKGTPVPIGSAETLKPGQSVTALGYTGGGGLQNSAGHVVRLHRHDGGHVVRSSNWFNSGASGGGLFDEHLRLVGILTFRLRGGESHYFAAPVEWVRALLADRTRYREVRPLGASDMAFWQRPVDLQPNFLKAAILERDADWLGLETLALDWARSAANDPEPWYLRGVALDQLNRLGEARQSLERSVAIEPTFGLAWFRLGMTLTKLGLIDQARTVLERLQSLESEFAKDLAEAMQRI